MPNRILPAEWARQDAVLLTWPHRHGDWAADLAEVEAVFIRIAREIAKRESLVIICFDTQHSARVWSTLSDSDADMSCISLCIAASNDSWARDHGPITVLEAPGKPRFLNFTFNGWGGKYPADLDDRINDRLFACDRFAATDTETVDLVLEGGSIDADGDGTLLTTSSCLLSESRNPGLDRLALESLLYRHLGADRILWLNHGRLEGDDTDGHIDTLARFTDPATIAYCTCNDRDDIHYGVLQAMHAELAGFRDRHANPYRLVGLPLPEPKQDSAGRRLPASYANFLIINDAVLVPAYDDPADQVAAERLQCCFPEREILSIPCTPLIRQFGSLHCVTMQLPAGALHA